MPDIESQTINLHRATHTITPEQHAAALRTLQRLDALDLADMILGDDE